MTSIDEPMPHQVLAKVVILLDLLLEEWDRVGDDVDIGPLPLAGAIADVVDAWRPHYEQERPGRREFMEQPFTLPTTVCTCDYCHTQRKNKGADYAAFLRQETTK